LKCTSTDPSVEASDTNTTLYVYKSGVSRGWTHQLMRQTVAHL